MGLSMRVDEKAVADCAPGPAWRTPALRPTGSAGSGAGGRAAAVARGCGALNPESGILTDPNGLLTRGEANPSDLPPMLAAGLAATRQPSPNPLQQEGQHREDEHAGHDRAEHRAPPQEPREAGQRRVELVVR